ncbi:hypothetical protein PIB30_067683 [Stylosanthes scabra]|uniref:Uncharacterized protein n=1 Tax=Stylosanthes scabra TaxID=79078 RepID=A0ABU6TQ27_9FABA|nr:hypothetical protein [Stylosanthes scabra]
MAPRRIRTRTSASTPSTPSDAPATPISAHPVPAVPDSASVDHVSAPPSPVSAPVTNPISTCVGKRGPSRGIATNKMLKSSATGKLPLPISLERLAPNGIHAELFASEVGIVTRQNAPLDVEKWSLVGDDAKFDIEDTAAIRQIILAKANVAYRSWRSRLREHYELYNSDEERLQNLPKNILPETWEMMVRKVQEIRKIESIMLCHGRASFAVVSRDNVNILASLI